MGLVQSQKFTASAGDTILNSPPIPLSTPFITNSGVPLPRSPSPDDTDEIIISAAPQEGIDSASIVKEYLDTTNPQVSLQNEPDNDFSFLTAILTHSSDNAVSGEIEEIQSHQR